MNESNALPVVILVGGLGSRLASAQGEKPKALVEIAGRPFLTWKIVELKKQNVSAIYLLTGFRGKQIYEFIESNDFGLPISMISDGPIPKGTGAALRDALPLINAEKFILTYGDNLLPLPLSDFVDGESSQSMMVTTSKLGAGESYNARVENSRVTAYSKLNTHEFNAIDYGYSVLVKRDIEPILLKAQTHDLSELFGSLANSGNLANFHTSLGYSEIGTPESLEKTISAMRNSLNNLD